VATNCFRAAPKTDQAEQKPKAEEAPEGEDGNYLTESMDTSRSSALAVS
jgi:hypothetical protein